jgi:Zn-dependent M28 family amino/carboxypeptidase
VGALLFGSGTFLVLTGGAFVSRRSHGALDDGGACAVLVRVAQGLAAAPLARTSVELALVSGEEIGVLGSRELVRSRYGQRPAGDTFVINLEFIGAASDFAVFRREQFSLRSFAPDPRLVALLDAVHRTRRDKPLHVTWYGAATDARSFLAAGIPSATLISDLPGHPLARHLHSAWDDRSRLDLNALDSAEQYLLAVLRAADAHVVASASDR